MSIDNGNAPAMPQEWEAYVEGNAPKGLTKREYFAGLAMQAIIATPEWRTDSSITDDAIFAADRLLRKLEKEPSQ